MGGLKIYNHESIPEEILLEWKQLEEEGLEVEYRRHPLHTKHSAPLVMIVNEGNESVAAWWGHVPGIEEMRNVIGGE